MKHKTIRSVGPLAVLRQGQATRAKENQHPNKNWRWSLLLSFLLAASVIPVRAGTYTWDARSGLWPYEVDPSMILQNNSPLQPVLSDNSLLLQNDAVDQDMFCWQFGTNLSFSPPLVIEAEVKFVTNSTHLPGFTNVTGVSIGFAAHPYQGSILFIDRGVISLATENYRIRGPSANVETDEAFHRYRIEADAPTISGSQIRVYYDGALTLTGQIVDRLGGADRPQIFFGDSTSGPWGTSYWRYFRHNAAARTPGTRMSIKHAAEICWWAEANKTYQVQWMPRLGTNAWTDFGLPVTGDDSTKGIFDSTRGQPQKVYRVVTLP